ncbi:hypothetical protein SAMN06298216_0556 [Spirosomataceae bacterium TFI 002]|nr:hypothetical protein SAMN06298216_0556 [Spirosomataceae bacterium TFI 002]
MHIKIRQTNFSLLAITMLISTTTFTPAVRHNSASMNLQLEITNAIDGTTFLLGSRNIGHLNISCFRNKKWQCFEC